jgi:hypothetical protein
MQRKTKPRREQYVPLVWGPDSLLTKEQQAIVDHQRRDIWDHGIRGALLERMAFEFGYVICCAQQAAKRATAVAAGAEAEAPSDEQAPPGQGPPERH